MPPQLLWRPGKYGSSFSQTLSVMSWRRCAAFSMKNPLSILRESHNYVLVTTQSSTKVHSHGIFPDGFADSKDYEKKREKF